MKKTISLVALLLGLTTSMAGEIVAQIVSVGSDVKLLDLKRQDISIDTNPLTIQSAEWYDGVWIWCIGVAIMLVVVAICIYVRRSNSSISQETVEPKINDKEEGSSSNDRKREVDNTLLNEEFLQRATAVVYSNMSNVDFDSQDFQQALNVTKSTLYRKLKMLTNMSPNEFVRHTRLQYARELLLKKSDDITITELAYITGFNTPRYFSMCFKREFGVTPTQFQK